jgi:hypothetical protein
VRVDPAEAKTVEGSSQRDLGGGRGPGFGIRKDAERSLFCSREDGMIAATGRRENLMVKSLKDF